MPRDYWSLVEPEWDRLVQWDDVSAFQAAFRSTDAAVRTLFAAHWLYAEVSNGGFLQFYWNSTGILAPEAQQAYVALGMPLTAGIVQQSMSWFPEPYPRERAARMKLLAPFEDADGDEGPFAQLDDEFYKLAESESGGFVRAANEFAGRSSQ